MDYQKLNAMTHNDAYPFPSIPVFPDALAGTGMFSTLDMLSAHNHVPVTEEDIPKTATLLSMVCFSSQLCHLVS